MPPLAALNAIARGLADVALGMLGRRRLGPLKTERTAAEACHSPQRATIDARQRLLLGR